MSLDGYVGPPDGDEMRMYQRRGHLEKAFPAAHPYVVNCCSNDSYGKGLAEMLELMAKKWLPMEKDLLRERRELSKRLDENPPRWAEEEEEEGAKKKVVKKKSRLQGAGSGSAKKQPATKPAPKSDWAPTDVNGMRIPRSPAEKSEVDVIRPGLIVLKRILPLTLQQHFSDAAIALGTPSNGMSGGWYHVDAAGNKHWNTGKGYGQMAESMDCFPSQFKELCARYLAAARAHSPDTPHMVPDLVLMNFYTPNNPGIYWHRDNSGLEKRAVALGLPVVSFSIGDSCVFSWKLEPDHPDQDLVLDSGDVLVFGGPSRLILHSVPKIYPNTTPKGLVMPKGRINLTFRQQLCVP
ncbi:Alpha-ketoglutarate-dependent dioxygenase AlkB [Diplonema papillatum]|nr:Alpha-ketoglutarate-dependent dioxygenase AlkB [Diplonema papillatum]